MNVLLDDDELTTAAAAAAEHDFTVMDTRPRPRPPSPASSSPSPPPAERLPRIEGPHERPAREGLTERTRGTAAEHDPGPAGRNPHTRALHRVTGASTITVIPA